MMTDDDHVSFDELAEPDSAPAPSARGGHGRRRAAPPPRRPSLLRTALPVLLVVLVLGGVGFGGVQGYRWLTSNISVEQEATDYPGPGTGEVVIEVAEGDTGTDIAATLVEADVIKAPGPFVTAFSNTPDASNIEPGLYRLQQQMPAAEALTMLLDPASLAGHRVIIPEGYRVTQIWETLSAATGIEVADFEAAAADYTALGIPENPAGSLEGYLFPARYDIPEEATAEEIITMMWERTESELTALGVAPEDFHRVLTLGSLVEKEARHPEDQGRVVRTIENRLAGVGEAGGTPMRLQLDSTVTYFTGSDIVSTTPEERATDSPYNTYLHHGLPIGPIASPGAAALEAAVNPPEGDWLYWVTVNTQTGETKFATTYAEHEQNVQEWRDWYDGTQGG